MTAKEKLLREVLDLNEAEAAAARIVIERTGPEVDVELEAILDGEAEELLEEMDAEEHKAGFGPLENVNPARGEVWLYERSDDKSRPVLILTREEAIGVLNRLLVVPATRSVRDIPTHVRLEESDGMREPCALALDNAFPARKALLTHRITQLGSEKLDEVCRALAAATSCG